MFAGPLGSKLPFLPIDYLGVVRDLELTDLKLHLAKAKIEERRESRDLPALRFPPSESVHGKAGSSSYFGGTGALRNVRRFRCALRRALVYFT